MKGIFFEFNELGLDYADSMATACVSRMQLQKLSISFLFEQIGRIARRHNHKVGYIKFIPLKNETGGMEIEVSIPRMNAREIIGKYPKKEKRNDKRNLS